MPTGKVVCSIRRASQTIGSGVGFGDATWPPTHIDVAPAASRRRNASRVVPATTPTAGALMSDEGTGARVSASHAGRLDGDCSARFSAA